MRPRNDTLRAEVLRLRQTGLSQTAIASMIGKSQPYVSQLLRGTPQVPVRRRVSGPAVTQTVRAERAVAAFKAHFDGQETDIRLDVALGAPDNLFRYQDCIDGARCEGSRRKTLLLSENEIVAREGAQWIPCEPPTDSFRGLRR
jgi:transcriptional regulator with XRE-family HTH domain